MTEVSSVDQSTKRKVEIVALVVPDYQLNCSGTTRRSPGIGWALWHSIQSSSSDRPVYWHEIYGCDVSLSLIANDDEGAHL